MQRVTYGVVGCGVIGPTHMKPSLGSDRLELLAVADIIPERAQRAADTYHAARVYHDGLDLIRDPGIEMVVLALPACHRRALALAAFAAGKHVLIEKPVAMNAQDVRDLIAARGRLKAACCSSRYRFITHHRIAADVVASGALGELRTVYMRSFFPAAPPPQSPRPEWRLKRALNGGGFLMNWGCYDLDYLLGLTGWKLQPKSVFAQTWPVAPHLLSHLPSGSDAETHYTALVRCEGGTMLSLERGEYMAIAQESAWQLVGSKGSLRLTMTAVTAAGPQAQKGATNWKQILFDEATPDRGTVSRVLWEGEEDLAMVSAGPVTDLAAAIRDDREPLTSLEKALVVQTLTDAIYASAACGDAVDC